MKWKKNQFSRLIWARVRRWNSRFDALFASLLACTILPDSDNFAMMKEKKMRKITCNFQHIFNTYSISYSEDTWMNNQVVLKWGRDLCINCVINVSNFCRAVSPRHRLRGQMENSEWRKKSFNDNTFPFGTMESRKSSAASVMRYFFYVFIKQPKIILIRVVSASNSVNTHTFHLMPASFTKSSLLSKLTNK